MNRKFSKFLTAVLAVLILVSAAGCRKQNDPADPVDYASSVRLDMASATVKQEVTVKNYVDGDTVHFYVPESVVSGGVLKARFLAINTPESTGKIEPYGKAASVFTKETLKSAQSIIIESDDGNWNVDSTGNRYLVWVWYKTAEMTEYRNLNIEILQNGLAIASNSQNNIYGSICALALEQAKAQKLNVYSGQKDPDFYEGPAVELTLKELRTNIESYRDILVAFNCVIASTANDTVYVEQYDPETDMYYGISIYYGNSGIGGDGLKILSVGNEARIVGKVQYYETGETWQISGLKYRAMKPDDPENIQFVSDGHAAAYVSVDAETFASGKRSIIVTDPETGEDKMRDFRFAELAMSTSVSMNGLRVESVYTTQNEGSSNGAMTLSCTCGGVPVTVRTAVFREADGSLITEERYLGKTIDIKGTVDYFGGEYQVKVFTADQITVK